MTYVQKENLKALSLNVLGATSRWQHLMRQGLDENQIEQLLTKALAERTKAAEEKANEQSK